MKRGASHRYPILNVLIQNIRARRCSLVASLSIAFVCSGCITASLATIGSVLGLAGTAASAGSEAYNLGKMDFTVMANYDACRVATIAACDDLQLHVRGDEELDSCKEIWEFKLQDDRDSTVKVRVQRRAEMMCQCRVDVGLFGSETTARLIMDRIRHHLPNGDPAETDRGTHT